MREAINLREQPKRRSRLGCIAVPVFFVLVCVVLGLYNVGVERREQQDWQEIEVLSETKWQGEIAEAVLIDDLKKRGFELSNQYKYKDDGVWVVSMSAGKEYRIDLFGSFGSVWWISENGIAKDVRIRIRPNAL